MEASWWTGENKSRLQNKRSRFWQKCWWWRLQSFNHKTTSWWLLLCCLSACGATLAEIFIFFLESAPYVYVQRVSDLRSLLNGWRVPELRQCIDSMRPCQLVPSFRKHQLIGSAIQSPWMWISSHEPSFEDCGASWTWVE